MITVGIVGARGYVGGELIRLLARHPDLRVAAVASRALAGRSLRGQHPEWTAPDLTFEDLGPEAVAARELDAWLLALPNGEAAPYVAAIDAQRTESVIVDLSADYRFDSTWTYGLPERNRGALRNARRIANPGCYATGTQLALAPLIEELDGPAFTFGVSGYSGAGTSPSPRNDPERLRDNLLPYGLVGHLHEREISHQLGHPVRFMPHVAPFFRGITLTIACTLRNALDRSSLEERYVERYRGEPLVRVLRAAPEVKAIAGQHHVEIGGFSVGEDGRRAVLIATIDNLLKGAATQAIQNLNLAFGLDELSAIAD